MRNKHQGVDASPANWFAIPGSRGAGSQLRGNEKLGPRIRGKNKIKGFLPWARIDRKRHRSQASIHVGKRDDKAALVHHMNVVEMRDEMR